MWEGEKSQITNCKSQITKGGNELLATSLTGFLLRPQHGERPPGISVSPDDWFHTGIYHFSGHLLFSAKS